MKRLPPIAFTFAAVICLIAVGALLQRTLFTASAQNDVTALPAQLSPSYATARAEPHSGGHLSTPIPSFSPEIAPSPDWPDASPSATPTISGNAVPPVSNRSESAGTAAVVIPRLTQKGFASLESLNPRAFYAPQASKSLNLRQSAPAILAPSPENLGLSAAQAEVIAALAEDFIENLGPTPESGWAPPDSPAYKQFAERLRNSTSETEFLIKQRYGHRAYVLMQQQAMHKLNGY